MILTHLVNSLFFIKDITLKKSGLLPETCFQKISQCKYISNIEMQLFVADPLYTRRYNLLGQICFDYNLIKNYEIVIKLLLLLLLLMSRWAGHVARMGEERGVYRVFVGKPEGKRPLGRPRRRWVDDIRMDLQEVGCGYMDWIGLAQDMDRWRTFVSAVMNLRVP